MSYDIYFCWKKKDELKFEEVAAWAAGFGRFKHTETQLWYENSNTGVYFSFDYEAGQFDDPENNVLPSGYFGSGLSFNLNFNRPSFFAYEAMPFVAELARRMGLCIFDPQQSDALALQCDVNSDDLIKCWLESNRRAILTLAQDAEFSRPNVMSLDSSMYFWRYMSGKADLEKACGEDLFVPRLIPVRRKGSGEAGTVASIAQDVASIVPQCDWVFVGRNKRSLFRDKADVTVVTSSEFLDSMSAQLRPFDWRDVAVRVISQESAKAAGKILRNLHSVLREDEFEAIAPDSFVDVDPSPPN